MVRTTTYEHCEHPIPPVFDNRSQVLILGSFPSPASREVGFFYGHPRNRMWEVLARVFDEPVPSTVERRRDFLLRNHIAMWDVLASCTIKGASDASIANEVPNDIAPILKTAPITTVICAGGAAARLYRRHCQDALGIPCISLPSTSPANAAASIEYLIEKWQFVRDCVSCDIRPILPVPQVIALEQALVVDGTLLAELMDRAGTWLAYRVYKHSPKGRVVVLAGSGNNGGDGWVAARSLARWGSQVHLVTAVPPAELSAQPAHDAAVQASEELATLGAKVRIAPSFDELHTLMRDADVVVDAILGTGFAHHCVRKPFNMWITAANEAHARGLYVVAADCPSGLSAQTGRAADTCIQADETVTMIVSKPGLHVEQGPCMCGTLHIAPLCDIASCVEQGVQKEAH